ncbi:hypothetical protein T08_244 [Trichinella sp. T8]|nr:hypothetical protein T08_14213 [Trichinella sp. T8]KRZ64142.1 hypothetical protein T08_244 [Trichinella sp. T8]
MKKSFRLRWGPAFPVSLRPSVDRSTAFQLEN